VNRRAQQSKFRYTNEAVGVFVLLTLLIFAAGLIYSARVREWFEPGKTLRIVLPQEGLSGLTTGSKVEILGTTAGEVRDILIDPSQTMHADVKIESDMAVFVRTDSKATIRKTFGIAGDAYIQITRGFGQPLDWEYAVIEAVSDRKPTDTVGELIDEIREKAFPVIEEAQTAIRAFAEVAEDLRDPDKGVQQLLSNINSITGRIDSGEGSVGRLLTDDKLVRELESLIARLDALSQQLTPMVADLNTTAQNAASFSSRVNAQSDAIPEITRSLKNSLQSAEKVLDDLGQTARRLPAITENVDESADQVPALVLQTQQVLIEVERLLKQLQSHWLLGGGAANSAKSGGRISPLEVKP
jgi:phospholipid/cholesterol/gamma-HCH transport system substrate-binding protein